MRFQYEGHAYFIFPVLACPFSLPGPPKSTFGACLFYISYFGMPLLSPGNSSFHFRGMPILYFPFWHAPSLSRDLPNPLSGHAYFIFLISACPFSLPGSPKSTFGACLFYISHFGMPLLSPGISSFHFRGMPWHNKSPGRARAFEHKILYSLQLVRNNQFTLIYKSLEFIDWHRLSKEISLKSLASNSTQEFVLFFCLNSL